MWDDLLFNAILISFSSPFDNFSDIFRIPITFLLEAKSTKMSIAVNKIKRYNKYQTPLYSIGKKSATTNRNMIPIRQ